MEAKISRQQIAKIWALAHALGLTREMLYLMVPRGSISALVRPEGSELIERLVRLQGKSVEPAGTAPLPPADPNAPTQEQIHFIYFLFGRLGWLENPKRVRGFLQKFCHVERIEQIADRKRAIALIEALKAIHKRQRRSAPDAS